MLHDLLRSLAGGPVACRTSRDNLALVAVTDCQPLLHLGCRQVVKSDSATVTIPELDFEIPAATQKGSITTVEGLLSDASENLK